MTLKLHAIAFVPTKSSRCARTVSWKKSFFVVCVAYANRGRHRKSDNHRNGRQSKRSAFVWRQPNSRPFFSDENHSKLERDSITGPKWNKMDSKHLSMVFIFTWAKKSRFHVISMPNHVFIWHLSTCEYGFVLAQAPLTEKWHSLQSDSV